MTMRTHDETCRAFRGASVREALTALRAAWGEDALVLSVDREADEFVVTANRSRRAAPPSQRLATGTPVVARMRRAGFTASYAAAVGREGEVEGEALVARLARDVPVYPRRGCRAGDPSGRRCFVFAGPTGVGKTTTLAKLAGRLVQDAGVEPVLVTLDTYRVAATEQLRAYADLLGLPFRVARDGGELQRVLAATERHAVCLVDTTGRSPLDAARVDELAGWLGADDRLERFLCLSATTAPILIPDLLERFAPLDADACILTKLDENPCCGAVLDAARDRGLPIAYVTDGQEVPRDLHVADAVDLVRRVLDGEAAFEEREMVA